MKHIIFIFLLFFLLISCGNKEVQLPQVSSVDLPTELTDFSPIYIFFDEKAGKSVLNKANLISSTNWVFHIDRRISLSEAGNFIEELQEKREKPSFHDKEGAKIFISVADMEAQKMKFLDISSIRFSVSNEKANYLKINQLGKIAENDTFFSKILYISGDISFQKFIEFLTKNKSQFNEIKIEKISK